MQYESNTRPERISRANATDSHAKLFIKANSGMAVYLYFMLKIIIKIYAALQNSACITSKDIYIKNLPFDNLVFFAESSSPKVYDRFYNRCVSTGESSFFGKIQLQKCRNTPFSGYHFSDSTHTHSTWLVNGNISTGIIVFIS